MSVALAKEAEGQLVSPNHKQDERSAGDERATPLVQELHGNKKGTCSCSLSQKTFAQNRHTKLIIPFTLVLASE